MLARAAAALGLEWNPPPRPERSRLDDWFLGAPRQDSRPAVPPIPFFMRRLRTRGGPSCRLASAGLFGGAVESFAQQFSAAQKQTGAIKHILPRQPAAAPQAPPAQSPQLPRRRGRPPAVPPAPARPQQPSPGPRHGARRKKPPQSAPAPRPAKHQAKRRS
ncbi:atherin-like [Pseudorasbora parva]|uniref:atherin-like n=1 Tax=Pseudorasbora parva TaxID=51549 RepID=UPI00351DF37E